MNFKSLLIISTLLALLGCGVKAKPLSPPQTAVPSYINSFLDSDKEHEIKPAPTPVK